MSTRPDRTKFLGGSDAAAILGVSRWKTPLQLYLQKRGEVSDDFALDPFRARVLKRGKRMEPVVIDMLEEEHGLKLVRRSTPENPNYHVDPEHPFLAAEIDFEWEVTPEIIQHFEDYLEVRLDPALVGTIQNGEIKTVHPFASGQYGEEGTDEVPIEYGAQAAHGLMVTGRQITLFGVLVGSDNLVVYIFKRDEETIAGMRDQEVRFWNENVLGGVPPKPQSLPDVYTLFKKLGTTEREATDEVKALFAEYRKATQLKSSCESSIEELKIKLGTFLLGAEKFSNPEESGRHVLKVDGRPVLNVTFESQYRLNEDKLRAKFPQVAEECAKLSTFYVFRQPKGKK